MNEQDHKSRIDAFKADLMRMTSIDAVRKHITTGPTAVLSSDDYYDLRREIANHFELHPSAVVVVVSCRTGFSIKPSKRYAPCTDVSDIDVAIVSAAAFDKYWDLVFDHWRSNTFWSATKRYKTFLRELFKGWLWPRNLPPRPHFQEAQRWAEFEDRLGKQRFGGRRSIGACLYRNWDRLEAYQSIHVTQCKTAISQGKA